MPEGRAPRAGELFRLPEHATTLELIAETRGEAFYHGELAEKLEAHSAACGGAMTRADLAAHANDWVEHDRAGLPRLHRCTRSRRTARASSA